MTVEDDLRAEVKALKDKLALAELNFPSHQQGIETRRRLAKERTALLHEAQREIKALNSDIEGLRRELLVARSEPKDEIDLLRQNVELREQIRFQGLALEAVRFKLEQTKAEPERLRKLLASPATDPETRAEALSRSSLQATIARLKIALANARHERDEAETKAKALYGNPVSTTALNARIRTLLVAVDSARHERDRAQAAVNASYVPKNPDAPLHRQIRDLQAALSSARQERNDNREVAPPPVHGVEMAARLAAKLAKSRMCAKTWKKLAKEYYAD